MKTLNYSLLFSFLCYTYLGDMMKKCLIISLLLLTACSKEISDVTSTDEIIDNSLEEIKEVYADDNPITVGLYQDGKLIKGYKTNFKVHNDIGYFEVCFTNEDDLGSTNVKRNFIKYFQQYENIDSYKIGYYVKFNIGDKIYEKTILDPSVKHEMEPYLYIYLYDDVHQADYSFYNHLEMEDVKNDTIFSSIKLYTPSGALDITSPITLMVFTYDGTEDFDLNGYYRGNSKYTIIIEKNV